MNICIDIVNACVLQCATCPRGRNTIPVSKDRMEFSLFKKIIYEIKSIKPDVHLYNWGEPFLHHQLADFVNEVKSNGLGCHLSSSLALPELPQLVDVLNAGLDTLYVSVPGYHQETHQINHIGGDIEIVKRHLMTAAKHCKNGTSIQLKFLKFGYNNNEVADFKIYSRIHQLRFCLFLVMVILCIPNLES